MNAAKKATIVVEGNFTPDYERYFQEYSNKVRNYLKKFQCTVIRRQLIKEKLYGPGKIDLIMLIDFEDEEVAKKAFYQDEYLQIIPLREKVFQTFNMYLADFDSV